MKYDGACSPSALACATADFAVDTGQPVDISPETEEVVSFFAAILETDYPKNPVFVKNFFDSFRGVLKEHPTVRSLPLVLLPLSD